MGFKAFGPFVGILLMLLSSKVSATDISCPRPREDQEWNKSEGRRYFTLGNTMFKAEKYAEAVLSFECVLKLVPYSVNTRHRLAESYEKAGDLTAAREQYLLALADDSPETEALRPAIKAKVNELEQRIARGESNPPEDPDAVPDRPQPHLQTPPPSRPEIYRPGLVEDFPALRHRVELNFGLASSSSAAPTGSAGYFFRQTAKLSWGATFGGMGFGLTAPDGAAITGKGYFVLPSAELMYLQYGGIFHVVFGGGLGYVFARLEDTQKVAANAHTGFASVLMALDYRLSSMLSFRLSLRYLFFMEMTGPGNSTLDSSVAGIYELGFSYRF